MKYFEGLSNRILSESCPKNCVRKLSDNSCRRGPLIVLESYPTNLPRRIVQRIFVGGLPINKTNILFGNDFHTWYKHV